MISGPLNGDLYKGGPKPGPGLPTGPEAGLTKAPGRPFEVIVLGRGLPPGNGLDTPPVYGTRPGCTYRVAVGGMPGLCCVGCHKPDGALPEFG